MGNNKPGGDSSFDWIFEVLQDLKAFATANGLPELAEKAEEAMATAKAELATRRADPEKLPSGRTEPLH